MDESERAFTDGHNLHTYHSLDEALPIIALSLSAFLFAICCWLYIAPILRTKKANPASQLRRADIEQADFTSKLVGLRQSCRKSMRSVGLSRFQLTAPTRIYNPLEHDMSETSWGRRTLAQNGGVGTWTAATGMSYYTQRKNQLYPGSTPTLPNLEVASSPSQSVVPPPPAYNPQSSSETRPRWFTNLTRPRGRSLEQQTIRSVSAPSGYGISKPIPHAEGPLPGPRLSIERSWIHWKEDDESPSSSKVGLAF